MTDGVKIGPGTVDFYPPMGVPLRMSAIDRPTARRVGGRAGSAAPSFPVEVPRANARHAVPAVPLRSVSSPRSGRHRGHPPPCSSAASRRSPWSRSTPPYGVRAEGSIAAAIEPRQVVSMLILSFVVVVQRRISRCSITPMWPTPSCMHRFRSSPGSNGIDHSVADECLRPTPRRRRLRRQSSRSSTTGWRGLQPRMTSPPPVRRHRRPTSASTTSGDHRPRSGADTVWPARLPAFVGRRSGRRRCARLLDRAVVRIGLATRHRLRAAELTPRRQRLAPMRSTRRSPTNRGPIARPRWCCRTIGR